MPADPLAILPQELESTSIPSTFDPNELASLESGQQAENQEGNPDNTTTQSSVVVDASGAGTLQDSFLDFNPLYFLLLLPLLLIPLVLFKMRPRQTRTTLLNHNFRKRKTERVREQVRPFFGIDKFRGNSTTPSQSSTLKKKAEEARWQWTEESSTSDLALDDDSLEPDSQFDSADDFGGFDYEDNQPLFDSRQSAGSVTLEEQFVATSSVGVSEPQDKPDVSESLITELRMLRQVNEALLDESTSLHAKLAVTSELSQAGTGKLTELELEFESLHQRLHIANSEKQELQAASVQRDVLAHENRSLSSQNADLSSRLKTTSEELRQFNTVTEEASRLKKQLSVLASDKNRICEQLDSAEEDLADITAKPRTDAEIEPIAGHRYIGPGIAIDGSRKHNSG